MKGKEEKWRWRNWNRGEDGKGDRKVEGEWKERSRRRKEGMQRIWTKCGLLPHAF